MKLKGNWSYPTAVKFGAGRIVELADHCKAAGLKRPLLVTDKALASLPITAQALAGRDPDELAMLILDGLPGSAMPGWRPLLTADEARWIADYLLQKEMP